MLSSRSASAAKRSIVRVGQAARLAHRPRASKARERPSSSGSEPKVARSPPGRRQRIGVAALLERLDQRRTSCPSPAQPDDVLQDRPGRPALVRIAGDHAAEQDLEARSATVSADPERVRAGAPRTRSESRCALGERAGRLARARSGRRRCAGPRPSAPSRSEKVSSPSPTGQSCGRTRCPARAPAAARQVAHRAVAEPAAAGVPRRRPGRPRTRRRNRARSGRSRREWRRLRARRCQPPPSSRPRSAASAAWMSSATSKGSPVSGGKLRQTAGTRAP